MGGSGASSGTAADIAPVCIGVGGRAGIGRTSLVDVLAAGMAGCGPLTVGELPACNDPRSGEIARDAPPAAQSASSVRPGGAAVPVDIAVHMVLGAPAPADRRAIEDQARRGVPVLVVRARCDEAPAMPDGGSAAAYEVRHNERFTSFFDLLDLQVLDANPSKRFKSQLKKEFGETPLIYNRILEDYRPQISSVMRYTFRSEHTDLIQRNYGYLSNFSFSIGGNLPYLVDRFIVTPGTVQGELPSPVSDTELSYSRYVKLTADYRRYIPLSQNTVFAFRVFGGYAIPFGQNSRIPINARFYAGGSNDIRGWEYYSLGPGGLALNEIAVSGGEIKLLAKVELRQTFIKNFLAADWIFALFADAGNVWYGPGNAVLESGGSLSEIAKAQAKFEKGQFHFNTFYKQIAVGSGFGLRLDFTYVIVRFDFAFRIHDLQRGWLENDELYFSFGIGHSF